MFGRFPVSVQWGDRICRLIENRARRNDAETLKWVDRAAKAGRPWFVCLDEIGQARDGVHPDSVDAEHNNVRCYALWGNLLTGKGPGQKALGVLPRDPRRDWVALVTRQ